jgi:heme oxygenase
MHCAKRPATRTNGCTGMYVREGATLGGRILARKLGGVLGPGHNGRRFFAGSPDDGHHWGELCATLERAETRHHLPAIIGAANATFAALEDWLGSARCRSRTGAEE